MVKGSFAVTTRITTPFTVDSTAADVMAGVSLTGRRAIVTGGSSGIGVETARAMAAAGAEVTLAVRDLAAGRSAAEDIITRTCCPDRSAGAPFPPDTSS